jgi:hypothetical protein
MCRVPGISAPGFPLEEVRRSGQATLFADLLKDAPCILVGVADPHTQPRVAPGDTEKIFQACRQ